MGGWGWGPGVPGKGRQGGQGGLLVVTSRNQPCGRLGLGSRCAWQREARRPGQSTTSVAADNECCPRTVSILIHPAWPCRWWRAPIKAGIRQNRSVIVYPDLTISCDQMVASVWRSGPRRWETLECKREQSAAGDSTARATCHVGPDANHTFGWQGNGEGAGESACQERMVASSSSFIARSVHGKRGRGAAGSSIGSCSAAMFTREGGGGV